MSKSKQKGKVYLVGAGPGAIGLLTLRGAEALRAADVVIYDALVNRQILNFAPESAELIFGGKRASHHAIPQDDLNQMLVDLADAGKTVIRLKGGDPYIFGRGGEEIAHLARAKIEFEVVPGVSSFSAAPAYAGIPLTHRDHSSEFVVITGGEPAVHDLGPLTDALARVNLPSHLETSGGYTLRGNFAWVTLSPKWWQLPLLGNLLRAAEFKIIVEDETSIPRWIAQLGAVLSDPTRPVWLHPEWSQRENPKVLNAISETVKTRGAPFRAGWQVHRNYHVDALDTRSRPPVPLGGDPARGV